MDTPCNSTLAVATQHATQQQHNSQCHNHQPARTRHKRCACQPSWTRPFRLVLILLIFCLALPVQTHASQTAGLPCEQSGMCSLGISKPWAGDIKGSHALRDMLQTVTYKRELIMTCMTGEGMEKWVDPIVQLYSEVKSLGFGHFLVLAPIKEACDLLHKAVPRLSCAWDSMDLAWSFLNGSIHTWFLRWKLFARAGRLGYNLLNVDADFIIFRDPYPVLKSTAMSDLQMWCNPEGGGPMHCNGGLNYIQNIKPDGPIAWVLKTIVDDQLWAMDDRWNYTLSQPGGHLMCHTLDQDMMFDAIKSAFVGRPLHMDVVSDCRNDHWVATTRLGTRLNKQQVLNNIRMVYDGNNEQNIRFEVLVTPPKDWLPSDFTLQREQTRQWVNRLTVPNVNYGRPEELGGRAGPEPRGNYTAQWLATLRSDCPDCPWWNDNRPLKNGKDELEVALGPKLDGQGGTWKLERFWDASLPVEHIGVGPAWLSNSLINQRTAMWTGQASGLPHPLASSHIHYWGQQHHDHKPNVRKVVGRYDWQAAAGMTQNGSSAFTARLLPQRVLALHPSIQLARTRTMAEYNTVLLGLLQLALLTNRSAVLPDVPCEAPWLHESSMQTQLACTAPLMHVVRHQIPQWLAYPVDARGDLVGGWVRNATLGNVPMKSAKEQGVFWKNHHSFKVAMGYVWDKQCLRDVGAPGAMIESEFSYWKTTVAAAQVQQEPNSNNTIMSAGPSSQLQLLPNQGPPEEPGRVLVASNTKGWSLADIMVAVPLGQAVQVMSRHHEQPLVYLGHPVALLASAERARRGDSKLHGAHANDAVGTHGTAVNHRQRRVLISGQEPRAHRHLQKAKAMVSLHELNTQLERVNQRIAAAECRLLMASETDRQQKLSLTFPSVQLGVIDEGRVQVLQAG